MKKKKIHFTCFKALIQRIYQDNICVLKDIWLNKYPNEEPKKHTFLEKLLLTPLLIFRAFSLSNFVSFFSPSGNNAYLFIDLYILFWIILIFICLFFSPFSPLLTVILVSYRVIDIISYQLCVLLIDSQRPSWKLASIRRSFLFSFLNLLEILAAFAILYLTIGNIIENRPDGLRIDSPGRAFYYSLVTMATLGYGEFIPADDNSRYIVTAELLTEILFILTIIPAFVSNITNQLGSRQYRDPDKRK